MSKLVLVIASFGIVAGFLPVPSTPWHRALVSFSEPSDVEPVIVNAAVVTDPATIGVDLEPVIVNEAVVTDPATIGVDNSDPIVFNAVDDLLCTLPATATGNLDDASRTAVTELVLALEKTSAVAAPATDPLLNGRWELLYSGGQAPSLLPSPTRQVALFLYAGGFTPGMFALKLATSFNLAALGSLSVTISRDQPRIVAEAALKISSSETVAKVECTLDAESDTRLCETYESLEVYGRKVDVPAALKYSRTLYVTYLDDELLIMRDASGAFDVLRRAEKEFTSSVAGKETVPSAANDDLAPGAG